eukprot:1156511-Pelagomonas_calceolata.AAC.3
MQSLGCRKRRSAQPALVLASSEAQERVASLEQQVCAQQRAAAAAQRSLEQARSEHKAGMAAMEVALAAAKQEAHEVKEESKKQAERVAEAICKNQAILQGHGRMRGFEMLEFLAKKDLQPSRLDRFQISSKSVSNLYRAPSVPEAVKQACRAGT